jgi:riboflavin kinase / FMN adenylyltransferase
MQVIRGIYNITERHQKCAVTIGNFDGLHLGHQALLAQLKAKAEKLCIPTLVILFEPQPNEFFSDYKVQRLMRFREKIAALADLGVDFVLCLRFDKQLASQTAEQFIEQVLVAKLATPYVLVGDDFQFGYQRQGNLSLLNKLGARHFVAENMKTLRLADARVSSSRIRDLLGAGELDLAAKLLGKTYSLIGRVMHGDKRGRLLGFPTANIALHRKQLAIGGVFAVEMLIDNGHFLGVANIGNRPTVDQQDCLLLEVHLLDFDRDIYGQQVTVQFIAKLRDEKKFADLTDLIEQIKLDVAQAKMLFQNPLNKF